MARGRELKVFLTSDVSRFTKGLRNAETRMDRFKKAASGALLGAAAAAGALAVKLGVDGVQAAIEDEASQKRLALALDNSTDATDDQIAAMEDYINVAQRKSGLDDGALRSGVELLARATGDLAQAQELANLSMNIAVQTGKDYQTVAKAVGMAAKGSAAPLRRLGIMIEDGVDPIKELNKQFSGALAADAETYAGGIRRVSTAWDELLESFGSGVIGDGGAPGQMNDLADSMYRAQPAAEGLGKSLQDIATAITSIASAAYEAKDALDDNALLNGLFNGVGRIAGGPTMMVGGAIEAWEDWQNPQQNPYAQYRPMRFATRKNDAETRGTARAAQREARTRQQP